MIPGKIIIRGQTYKLRVVEYVWIRHDDRPAERHRYLIDEAQEVIVVERKDLVQNLAAAVEEVCIDPSNQQEN